MGRMLPRVRARVQGDRPAVVATRARRPGTAPAEYARPVLSRELELADIDARHWRHWWSLLVPARVLDQPRWALAVVEGALSYDQDLVEQGMIALRAVKRHAGKGIWTSPALLELIPAPAYDGLQRTFDLLVPDRSALLAYVIDDDRRAVHASIIAVKRGGDLTRAATHRALGDRIGEAALARKWETEYERVLEVVEQRFAKPSIGVFLERATLMRILAGPSDQLARELNAKRVVIDPAPAWLLGLLGGATVAAMATRGARALAGMLPASARVRAADLAQRAGTAIRESGPFAQLGFDPIELWTRLRGFYR